MRQNAPQRRGRGRPTGRRGFNNSPNRSYDSSGPDIKIRGTAATVYDKYQSLGRDAVLSGDRVAAENFFQHAEHYYRLVQAAKQQAGEGEQREGRRQEPQLRGENDSEAYEANVTAVAEGDEQSMVPEAEAIVEVATDNLNSDVDRVNAGDADETYAAEAEVVCATPINPAELAAMSESGRRSRGGDGVNGRDGDSQIDSGGEKGDDGAETASAGPRRQPRRRRRPVPDVAVAESEGVATDSAEDAETS